MPERAAWPNSSRDADDPESSFQSTPFRLEVAAGKVANYEWLNSRARYSLNRRFFFAYGFCFFGGVGVLDDFGIPVRFLPFVHNDFARTLIVAGFVIGSIIGVTGYVLRSFGSRLVIRARKIELARASDELVRDSRPFILYLRSFLDDTITSKPGTIETFYYLPSVRTEEEQLISVLSGVGPVVAVGKPGEDLPELGARRVYFSNQIWQQSIGELMSEAALVVLRPGRTSGIWWEISYAMAKVRPERLLIVIPFDTNEYEVFAQEFERRCGVRLPKYNLNNIYQIAAFVYFDLDGSPHLLAMKSNFTLYLRSLTEHLAPYIAATLNPVLVRIDASWKESKMSAWGVTYFVLLIAISFMLGVFINHFRRTGSLW
jgi:hypothetical protein